MATLHLPPGYFALYRAYLEGLDVPVWHAYYGVLGTGVRITRPTLTIAARDIDAAHLLRLKPGSLPRDAHVGPRRMGRSRCGRSKRSARRWIRTQSTSSASSSRCMSTPIRRSRRRRSIAK
ncbi:hypothetical protein WJ78_25615 [Burkholderia ubonensis]|uniref:hypothetical protein n=1 Tax=Burkholderia ubonensis TaxID=101571 RepID=UPI0007597691|nr:hypothetical protein [Burkholderia ubonensis]KVO60054.1 hypothetical protein WJ78_25615 [Burkholderia ubonensis]KVP87917.1 hypothetical protein WJ97_27555 [Burkholderia ubonensis]KVV55472.1 hypothetical protein WK82_05345 [Burkholderia ubonensis]KVW29499.1 hypothetical protein WK92_28890 [Burkholderia ubonensis]KVX21691.1 hypothetical protein WL01_01910 [Burkholderia ubonensis]